MENKIKFKDIMRVGVILTTMVGIGMLAIKNDKSAIAKDDSFTVEKPRHWRRKNELAASRLPNTGGILSKIITRRIFHRGPGRYTQTVNY